MVRKDLVALYGRLGLVVAAFAFVLGIIAGPILQKLWSPPVTVSEQIEKPDLHPQILPVGLPAEEQG